ncbi:FAD-dependent oxidoreductase [Paenibacillus sp. YN15]|uniref:FAD-dependent oxidoreductase n=1 Tax=Paenibacillus sp. YN15 TaxID=1742774 RepID=UPI000DCED781|nr:FAD-dependent oxidoreductase [Paenibacillus sp. YN15]RAU98907.1 FAD-dependent oxidoreductase [Paenibacillus sp. YN15]
MMREIYADIAVIGGGLGGCAAALAAAKRGKRVVLTEETYWIGGQLTSQAVPPDEHPWIEQFGCTRSYRQFRNGVRDYYRRNFPLTEAARSVSYLNPGGGGVSKLCHEPRTALAVLQEMLAPYVHSGKVIIYTRHQAEAAEVDGDRVIAVRVKDLNSGDSFVLWAPYFLDATECGDLLPMTGTEYVTGSESRRDTGEPHALAGEADPLDMQSATHCMALEYFPGEDHTIERPAQYDFWRSYKPDFWVGELLSWTVAHHCTFEPVYYPMFEDGTGSMSRWRWRKVLDKELFAAGAFASDITIVNWQQNDYWLGSLYEVSEEERQKHLEGARQLTLSLLYWAQTEAPRPDGGAGYPGLKPCGHAVGTADGLAMYPYIRESRRIRAEFTVLEQHISPEIQGDQAAVFHDSVGIGSYRIDLHPSTGMRHYIDIACLPFQIPLGSLIPVRMDNLLPACKNLGVTHITNGCYRLHPVEWNIGEAAGYLAAYCLEKGLMPRQVRNTPELLEDFQKLLVSEGIELKWPKVHAL